MRTPLTPEELAALHAKGKALAEQGGGFVNPYMADRAAALISQRGEEWTKSVLLRGLTRRVPGRRDLPWLNQGELETLVLAEQAELDALDRAAEGA